ncbi:diacylglycerol kinase family protein [Holzapfeliella sp. He02]|uniref:Diacylglycerol kinase family protein n=1 Tax=Holzapfeliella saturejae TaxID=3082953 RepID=A0ABU8SGP1_9LACO
MTMALKDKKQIQKNRHFFQSLRHAIDGILHVLKVERNFKIDIFVSIIVILISFYYQISSAEWLWVVFSIFSVIIAEVANTSIETVVDLAADFKYHDYAKYAKDTAAGFVVLTAMMAVIIGAIIFIPKFIN